MNIASGSSKVGRSQCLLYRLSHQFLQLRPIPAWTLHRSLKIKTDRESKKQGRDRRCLLLSLMVVLRSGRILLSVVVNLLFPPPHQEDRAYQSRKIPLRAEPHTYTDTHTPTVNSMRRTFSDWRDLVKAWFKILVNNAYSFPCWE